MSGVIRGEKMKKPSLKGNVCVTAALADKITASVNLCGSLSYTKSGFVGAGFVADLFFPYANGQQHIERDVGKQLNAVKTLIKAQFKIFERTVEDRHDQCHRKVNEETRVDPHKIILFAVGDHDLIQRLVKIQDRKSDDEHGLCGADKAILPADAFFNEYRNGQCNKRQVCKDDHALKSRRFEFQKIDAGQKAAFGHCNKILCDVVGDVIVRQHIACYFGNERDNEKNK